MFNWVKRIFSSKTKRGLKMAEYQIEDLEKKMADLREDLLIIKKLSHLKEYVKFDRPSFSGAWGVSIDDVMEKKRNEARSKGLQFLHAKKNGDEVWARYEVNNG